MTIDRNDTSSFRANALGYLKHVPVLTACIAPLAPGAAAAEADSGYILQVRVERECHVAREHRFEAEVFNAKGGAVRVPELTLRWELTSEDGSFNTTDAVTRHDVTKMRQQVVEMYRNCRRSCVWAEAGFPDGRQLEAGPECLPAED